jgi:hypothetical protein
MRYFIDFRSLRKRPIKKESEEEESEEIKTIFKRRMDYFEKQKNILPPKRLSRLGRSPSLRSRAENKNKICYQYAAIHLFENFIELFGYNYEEFMNSLNLDLVDEKYLDSFQKPIYLKIFHDPDETSYLGISSIPFEDNDDEYLVVEPTLRKIDEDEIFLSFHHPNDEQLKLLSIKREQENEHIFEELLQSGSAYDYLDSILDILSEANLIDQTNILSKKEDKQNKSTEIGKFIVVLFKERRHVLSFVSINENKYELGDNNERHTFSSVEELLNHVKKHCEIVEIQNVYIVQRNIGEFDETDQLL